MNTSVDISYYPLKEEFIPPIKEFIDRMNNYDNLVVRTNGMSTQIFGEYVELMSALTGRNRKINESSTFCFCLKIVNADLQVYPNKHQ